jgi:Ca2+:H+ antiporter
VPKLKPSLDWLLVLIPVSMLSEFVLHNELLTFATAAGAILPLAGLIGRSTEQLSLHAGPRTGGLLNATFGNLAELVIAITLILRDEIEVVKASLTGSILGNLLLVLGLSFFLGGMRHREQSFNAQAAGVHASSLTLAVIGLLMPALFVLTTGNHVFAQREVVSGTVAGVLILLYAAALVFMMVTHEHLFRTPAADEHPVWSLRKSIGMLAVVTVFIVIEAEALVGSLEPALASLKLSKFFVGLIIVPIIGNAAENSSAIRFAMRNKLDISLEIAIGASTQIALFVAPVLVFLSLLVGHPMDFVFSTFEVAAVGLAAVIVAQLSNDGKSNWLEGLQLVGAYVIMAISFFFVRQL